MEEKGKRKKNGIEFYGKNVGVGIEKIFHLVIVKGGWIYEYMFHERG